MVSSDSGTVSNLQNLNIRDFDVELEKSRNELIEIGKMLEHSQQEVSKLAQRNASATAHLQRIQNQFEKMTREEIRSAYDTALDAQQRLFVMRGQVEKLQSDLNHQERYIKFIEQAKQTQSSDASQAVQAQNIYSSVNGVEMLIQAQETERQSLSRQMHDGPAQALSNFILQTEIAMRLFDVDPEKAKNELINLKGSASSTFQKVRDYIFELRPMMLDDLGLSPTIKRYIEATQNQSGIEIHLTVTGVERRFEPYLEVMVFRAIQEFLKNAVRHSQASQINLHLDLGDTNIKVICEDDGKGFDVDGLEEDSFVGLKLMRERAEMLGGNLGVDSVIGQGTRVTYQVPCVETSSLT